jgi:hypothetical protein
MSGDKPTSDNGLSLWRFGRGFVPPMGPNGVPFSHAGPPPPPPRRLPGEAVDPRFSEGGVNDGRSFGAAEARAEADCGCGRVEAA